MFQTLLKNDLCYNSDEENLSEDITGEEVNASPVLRNETLSLNMSNSPLSRKGSPRKGTGIERACRGSLGDPPRLSLIKCDDPRDASTKDVPVKKLRKERAFSNPEEVKFAADRVVNEPKL